MSNIRSRASRNNNGRPNQRRNNNSNGRNNGHKRPSSGRSRPNHGVNLGSAAKAKAAFLDKAKEALTSGDRVTAENYFQHAEHYGRIVLEFEEEKARHSTPEPVAEEANDSESNSTESAVIASEAEIKSNIPKELAL